MFTLEGLLSGFLGAIIAVFLTETFKKYGDACKLNLLRKVIIVYLKLAHETLPQVENEYGLLKQKISGTTDLKGTTDLSHLDVSYIDRNSFETLRQVCYDEANYITLLQIRNSLSIICTNSPEKKWVQLTADQNSIWREISDLVKAMPHASDYYTKEFERMKAQGINAMTQELHSLQGLTEKTRGKVDNLILALKGSDEQWIYKYLW